MAQALGESRGQLLSWINELLQLNLTKVESCGSGAVYCQIIDSVYQDVPLSKVKFGAKSEYEYIQNFKVLTAAFKTHKIDKPIPVEQLIKCKMQDNLEMLQWMKKWWDQTFPGDEYDPISRRKAQTITGSGAPSRSTSAPRTASTGAAPIRRPAAASSRGTDQAVQVLTGQMNELKVSVENLEKERDFYFAKLRDIEIIVGARLEALGDVDNDEVTSLVSIRDILYATEEGFEVPDEGEIEGDEAETF